VRLCAPYRYLRRRESCFDPSLDSCRFNNPLISFTCFCHYRIRDRTDFTFSVISRIAVDSCQLTVASNIMSVRSTVIPVGAGSPISIRKTRNLVNPPHPRYYLRSIGHDISPVFVSIAVTADRLLTIHFISSRKESDRYSVNSGYSSDNPLPSDNRYLKADRDSCSKARVYYNPR
jgi:hypothetical protein